MGRDFVSRDIKMRGTGSVFSGKIHTKAENHCRKKKEKKLIFYVYSYEIHASKAINKKLFIFKHEKLNELFHS